MVHPRIQRAARGVTALLLLAGAPAAGGAAPSPSGLPSPAGLPSPTGLPSPGVRHSPAPADGAVVARSFDALQRLVNDAAGPRRIRLLPQQYLGDLVVKRSLVLEGEPGSVLVGTGHGTVVTITADDVALRSVAVRHSGRRQTTEDAGVRASGNRVRLEGVSVEDALFGISMEACHYCTIERVQVTGIQDEPSRRGDGIKLWESDHAHLRHASVKDARDVVVWYSRHATVEDFTVTGSRYATHFMYSHDSVVRRAYFARNVVGVFVMYSNRIRVEDSVLAGARGAAGMGVGFKDSDTVDVRGNWLVANTVGTYLDSTPRSQGARVRFDGNVLALNEVGVRLHSSSTGVAFHDNEFRQNTAMLEVEGGGDGLAVDFRGNYFSDYEGFDLNGDGTGDVAYEEKLLSNALTDAHPVLQLFQGTAAMRVVDVISRAVPVLAARTLLVDHAPRMTPRLQEDE